MREVLPIEERCLRRNFVVLQLGDTPILGYARRKERYKRVREELDGMGEDMAKRR